MQYEPNEKHKTPWQRGRRGSLCPRDMDVTAQALLADSKQLGKKRYATHEGKAYRAQMHGNDVWHGYPVGWELVPESLRRAWLSQGRIRRRDVKKHWNGYPP